MLKVSRSAHFHVDPASHRHNAHLWKAVAPFVSLEEQLFAQQPRWLDDCADAFVESVLPEASPLGRAA